MAAPAAGPPRSAGPRGAQCCDASPSAARTQRSRKSRRPGRRRSSCSVRKLHGGRWNAQARHFARDLVLFKRPYGMSFPPGQCGRVKTASKGTKSQLCVCCMAGVSGGLRLRQQALRVVEVAGQGVAQPASATKCNKPSLGCTRAKRLKAFGAPTHPRRHPSRAACAAMPRSTKSILFCKLSRSPLRALFLPSWSGYGARHVGQCGSLTFPKESYMCAWATLAFQDLKRFPSSPSDNVYPGNRVSPGHNSKMTCLYVRALYRILFPASGFSQSRSVARPSWADMAPFRCQMTPPGKKAGHQNCATTSKNDGACLRAWALCRMFFRLRAAVSECPTPILGRHGTFAMPQGSTTNFAQPTPIEAFKASHYVR